MISNIVFEQNDDFPVDFGDVHVVKVETGNYEKLENKPRLDGREIVGNVSEKDPTVPNWAKSPTKPDYNAKEIGAVAEAEMHPMTAADLEAMWEKF